MRVAQAGRKFPRLLWNQKIQDGPPLGLIPNHFNPVNTLFLSHQFIKYCFPISA